MSGRKPQMLSSLLPFLLATILSAGARRSDHYSDSGRFFRAVTLLGGLAIELGDKSWSARLHIIN